MSTANPDSSDTASLSLWQTTLLIGGLLTTAVGQSFIFATLPPLGREVGLDEVRINIIISLSALVFSVSSAWWGRFSDRVGRKPVILIGLGGYAAGNLAFALVFNAGLEGWVAGTPLFLIALLVRCMQSLVMSATQPGAAAYTADHSARRLRTRSLARLGTATSLGMIFGPILAGALAGWGLLFPLYAATVFAAMAMLVIARYLPSDRHSDGPARPVVKLRLTDPRIRLFLLCSFGAFTGFSSIQQTLGFRLQDMLSLDGTDTARYTGFALMASALATFVMQMTIAQRWSGSPLVLIRLGLGLLTLGSVGIALADQLNSILLGMAFMGAGLGLTVPAVAAGASLAVSPEEQGAAAGLVTALPAAGFVIGPVSGGYLYTLEPSASAFGASAVIGSVFLAAMLGRKLARFRKNTR